MQPPSQRASGQPKPKRAWQVKQLNLRCSRAPEAAQPPAFWPAAACASRAAARPMADATQIPQATMLVCSGITIQCRATGLLPQTTGGPAAAAAAPTPCSVLMHSAAGSALNKNQPQLSCLAGCVPIVCSNETTHSVPAAYTLTTAWHAVRLCMNGATQQDASNSNQRE